MLEVMQRFEGNIGKLGNLSKSIHFNDRAYRLVKEDNVEVQDMFIVNKDGKHQLHIILNNATILVVDKAKKKIVTILNARVGQIKRYYHQLNLEPCAILLQHAEHNVKYGINLI